MAAHLFLEWAVSLFPFVAYRRPIKWLQKRVLNIVSQKVALTDDLGQYAVSMIRFRSIQLHHEHISLERAWDAEFRMAALNLALLEVFHRS
jgi:hypothetical protein